MRHLRRRRKLSLVTEHRKALMRSLVIGLVEHNRIRTTYARAKEASRFADHMVTIAKGGNLHARRELIRKLDSRPTAKKLVDDIAPLFKDVAGGYTRVMRYDFRPGDGAQMAFLEFTRVKEVPETGAKKEKAKKKAKKAPAAETAAEPEKPKKQKRGKPAAEKQEKAEPASPSQEGKPESGLKEEPKKGGFLGNLRKFLTGD
ncbi:MAG: 50S ribosomal protein L17 [Candidatus Omnitrophica bacterium]|nr:50S ribosomal protein L17 [Candidatus Omnitrophota bacterium]